MGRLVILSGPSCVGKSPLYVALKKLYPQLAGRLTKLVLYDSSNHDGEDSDNWDAFYYPVGDARQTLLAFAGLPEGRPSALVEKWEQDLVP